MADDGDDVLVLLGFHGDGCVDNELFGVSFLPRPPLRLRDLVPLHNACSYGHYEVTKLLVKHGACVNAMDLWQFTPLHEAASKNRVEVCSLLLSYGADPNFLNCHNKSSIDLAPTMQLKERLA
ncbi:hypothetical protein CRUP_030910, partial [Coryphaenoides rupestris]